MGKRTHLCGGGLVVMVRWRFEGIFAGRRGWAAWYLRTKSTGSSGTFFFYRNLVSPKGRKTLPAKDSAVWMSRVSFFLGQVTCISHPSAIK